MEEVWFFCYRRHFFCFLFCHPSYSNHVTSFNWWEVLGSNSAICCPHWRKNILKRQKLHDWSPRSQYESKGSPAHEQTAANKTAIKALNARVRPAYVTINVTGAFKVHITYFICNTKFLIITNRLFKQTIFAHVEVLPVDLRRCAL